MTGATGADARGRASAGDEGEGAGAGAGLRARVVAMPGEKGALPGGAAENTRILWLLGLARWVLIYAGGGGKAGVDLPAPGADDVEANRRIRRG